MKNKIKKVLIFCCVIIAVLIILDFIPIKFVCKLSEFENNIHENVFISEHTAVTGGDWYADIKTNPWLTNSVDFILLDETVYGNISEIFTTENKEPSFNQYVF